MNGAQSRVTRFRAPGGAPDAGDLEDSDEPGYRDRPMPLAASILWTPLDGAGQGPPTIPIFITQRALAALHDHGTMGRETRFGLLAGDLFRTPDSGAPYLVVESTIRLPGETGGGAKDALLEGWVVAQDLLRKTGDQLVGWYRVGESAALALSGAELDSHAALFPQPWQIVVTVGSGGPPTGGVFRPAAEDGSGQERLPFYEIVDDAAIGPGGSKSTRLAWTNYRSAEPAPLSLATVAPATLPDAHPVHPSAPAAARRAPLVFMPDQVGEGRVARPSVGAGLRRLWQRGVVRLAAYAAAGLVALVVLVRVSLESPAAPEPSPVVTAVVVPTPQQRLDRAADTMALAIAAFDLRARLFANRQMQCPELARGLVQVEERWTSYNAVRKDGGVVLDSARTARDRALYADADGVERRFERSGCPRP